MDKSDGKCECFAYSEDECVCGAWHSETDKLRAALEVARALAINGDVPNNATIEAWSRLLGMEEK